ncbi:Protein BIG GRAIN 1-like A [Bienertia sinuspersici]
MSSLRRACLVEKWMEKKVNDKVIAKAERDSNSSSTTLLEEFDLQDALSCMSKNNKKFQDDGVKRTVRFCPVSVIVDDDSQACGYKSLREEKAGNHDSLLNSSFGRSMSKRYEELRKLNGLERESEKLQQQKKLEEAALDLLSGYWDSRLNRSHDLSSKEKGNDDNYDDNHGINYVQNEDEDDDGVSCSSSDLFELDHLSLIGNELPVYETTKLNSTNIM